MTINIKTLQCGECGSSVLNRSGTNQYVCAHCGCVSLVEDSVSQRIEKMIGQVQAAASERVMSEQLRRQQLVSKEALKALVYALLLLLLCILAVASYQLYIGQRHADAFKRNQQNAAPKSIPTSALTILDAHEVRMGHGIITDNRLLIMARNDSDQHMASPQVVTTFFNGNEKLTSQYENFALETLAPGETAPILVRLPSDKFTRHELQVSPLRTPRDATPGPTLRFDHLRVLEKDRTVRVLGRIVNIRKDVNLVGCQTLVVLYDAQGAIVGMTRGSPKAHELKPGEQSSIDIRMGRFGNNPVAAWEYRIDYQVSEGKNLPARVTSAEPRVVRVNTAPERLNASQDIYSDIWTTR